MSLNGLDAPAVLEAYQAALTDPGGWFLLKYASRDEVELLSHGGGGFGEASAVIAEYSDKSPLYGFLLYRRRKVVVKYIPEGTSRLLQARTTVHFQAFADTFSPHDATFSATSPTDLSESALSATCSLHTSGSLYSANGSIKRQNLDGITEDAEEHQAIPAGDVSRLSSIASPRSIAENGSLNHERPLTENAGRGVEESPDFSATLDASLGRPLTATHYPRKSDDYDLPSETSSRLESPEKFNDDTLDTPPYSPRPSTSDMFRYGLASLKPKVKLFPRPVTDDKAKRPAASGPARQKLPSGMRTAPRRTEQERPRSQRSTNAASSIRSISRDRDPKPVTNAPPVPPMPKETAIEKPVEPSLALPPTPSSIATGQNSMTDAEQHKATKPVAPMFQHQIRAKVVGKPNGMTPEKQRLLKALEMRKKQQSHTSGPNHEKQSSNDVTESPDPAYATINAEPAIDRETSVRLLEGSNGQNHQPLGNETNATEALRQREFADSEPQVPFNIPSGSVLDSEVQSTTKAEGQETTVPDAQQQRISMQSNGGRSRRARQSLQPSIRSAADSLSDDSLFEELQTAEVQEATSITVAQPPRHAHPGEGLDLRRPSNISLKSITIRSPQAATPTMTSPIQVSPRSLGQNSPGLQSMNSQEQVGIAKKPNVSTGISRRIQALAESTSRDANSGAMSRLGSTPEGSSSLLTVTNLAGWASPRVPSARQSNAGSRASSPARQMYKTAGMTRSSQSTTGDQPLADQKALSVSHKPDSTTVTARIVRHTRMSPSESSNGSKALQETPVEQHDSAGVTSESRFSTSRAERPPSAFSSRPASRDSNFTSMTKHSMENGWRYISRRRTEESKSPPLPRAERSMSNGSLVRVDEDGEVKSSRTARLLKRMSGFSTSSRKNPVDVSTDANSGKEVPEMPQRMRPAPFALGDVNVQFPDTLLWKRRWVEVDSHGNLVLGASSNERQRGASKKYHLNEFGAPAIPSQERQELPHSVILDFLHGGTLQLAFEEPAAQKNFLRKLVDNQAAWFAYDS